MLTWSEVKVPEDPRELRQYGLTMAAVLAGVFGTAVPLLRSHRIAVWPWVLAAAFLAPAIVRPKALGGVYLWWMRFGVIMGAITSRIALSLVFFLVVLPIGAVRRRAGHDAMKRGIDRRCSTYREVAGDRRHNGMEVPF